jgi:hypothetical protein
MIPKTVYEMLPYVYIAAGIAAALLIYNSYAIVAEILLLTLSFVILHMRLKNRTDKMECFERLYMREKKKNE